MHIIHAAPSCYEDYKKEYEEELLEHEFTRLLSYCANFWTLKLIFQLTYMENEVHFKPTCKSFLPTGMTNPLFELSETL